MVHRYPPSSEVGQALRCTSPWVSFADLPLRGERVSEVQPAALCVPHISNAMQKMSQTPFCQVPEVNNSNLPLFVGREDDAECKCRGQSLAETLFHSERVDRNSCIYVIHMIPRQNVTGHFVKIWRGQQTKAVIFRGAWGCRMQVQHTEFCSTAREKC